MSNKCCTNKSCSLAIRALSLLVQVGGLFGKLWSRKLLLREILDLSAGENVRHGGLAHIKNISCHVSESEYSTDMHMSCFS